MNNQQPKELNMTYDPTELERQNQKYVAKEPIISNCPLCGEKGLHILGEESMETQQCINCGFATSVKFRVEGDNVESCEAYNDLTDEIKGWSQIANNHIWIPSFITLPFGMLYPFNNDSKEMKWAVATMVDIPEDEQKNYPIPGQEGKFYSQKYDTDNAKIFDEFIYAMHEINERAKKDTNTQQDSNFKLNLNKD